MVVKLKTVLKYAAAIILAAVGYEAALAAIRKKRLDMAVDKLKEEQRKLGIQNALTQAELENAATEFARQRKDLENASPQDIRDFYLSFFTRQRR